IHFTVFSFRVSFCLLRSPPRPPLFPYTTLFRSRALVGPAGLAPVLPGVPGLVVLGAVRVGIGHDPDLACVHQLGDALVGAVALRSEEHTSELQSRFDLVCRLLLEKKKEKSNTYN